MISIDWQPSPRKLRQFAVAAIVMGAAIAFLSSGLWLGLGLVFVGLVGCAIPRVIRPLFLGLSVVTTPVGWVVSNLLLLLIYLFVVTPLGLIFRLTGRRTLLLHPATSTWERRPPPSSPSRYLRQY